LENTSDVPAIDLLLVAGAIPAIEGEQALRKLVTGVIIDGMPRSAGNFGRPKPQNQVVFPSEKTTYESNIELIWRDEETASERRFDALSDILIVSAFFYTPSWDDNAVMYSVCVHEVRSGVTHALLEAAKADTGIMLDGKIDRWSIGWTAA
jgi:hypothetical protein